MKQLNVYLIFNGTCAEALNFYKSCLNGEIVSRQTFGEAPMESDEAQKDRIMHAEFRAGDIYFMASDSTPDHPVQPGSMVWLSVNLDNVDEQKAIFDKLAEGGQVAQPLEDTFWGARFGMLTDKFGVKWMLNCEIAE
jgi:PhnB protein